MTWKFMAKYCLSSNMSICSINFHGKLFHLTAFFFSLLKFCCFLLLLLLLLLIVGFITYFHPKIFGFICFGWKYVLQSSNELEYIHFKVKKTLKWNDTTFLSILFVGLSFELHVNTNMNNLSEFHGIVSIKTQCSLQFIHHQHETWFKTRF